MKKTAVLCAASNQYAFALFTTLKTLVANSPQLVAQSDIYVYSYNWPEHIRAIFTSHFPITLIEFDLPDFIPRVPVIKRFTPALFARFEAFARPYYRHFPKGPAESPASDINNRDS